MKILLIHQNFPGQFLHLAPALAERGHTVVALTVDGNKRPSPVPVLRYRVPKPPEFRGAGLHYAQMAERGATVARACARLRREKGFVPDVVFGHGGWGETLFLREVWPEARHLTYAEFYYRARGADTGFDPEFPRDPVAMGIGTVARRTHLLQALVEADAAVAPTAWQASTFPRGLRDRIRVIHDGIDTDRLKPNPDARFKLPDGSTMRASDEVVTFVNRNLEPYRGYHVFMRALPRVLKERPSAQIVIVGGDRQSYGPAAPDGKSWKQIYLEEVRDRLDLTRVHFVGQLPYPQFVALMQVSRAHAYLTYPFILSWSMLEAMSVGALVIGSRTAPVQEVIRDGENGRLVDFFDIDGWSRALIEALSDPDSAMPLRQAARQTILDRYDLRRICLPRMIDFVEGRD